MKTTKTQTIQDRYNQQVKADRRAAALERRTDDYRVELRKMYQK